MPPWKPELTGSILKPYYIKLLSIREAGEMAGRPLTLHDVRAWNILPCFIMLDRCFKNFMNIFHSTRKKVGRCMFDALSFFYSLLSLLSCMFQYAHVRTYIPSVLMCNSAKTSLSIYFFWIYWTSFERLNFLKRAIFCKIFVSMYSCVISLYENEPIQCLCCTIQKHYDAPCPLWHVILVHKLACGMCLLECEHMRKFAHDFVP